MADDSFENNLLRAIAAEVYVLVSMTAAREMFEKSYFALGIGEKALVDQAALAAVGANYQTLTPEYLKGQATPQRAGFPIQSEEKKP